ncbi:MAG: hypothetical protein VB857_10310 [Pirellulaceae bacterium]
MHDRVRKTCCRLVFLVVVAAPTLLMLSWGIARNTSLVKQQTKLHWQQQLAVKLGLKVTLAAVENPRPGLIVLRGAKLHDAESGLDCGSIAIIRLSQSAGQQVVQLEDLQLQIAQRPETWQWFVQHLLRQTGLGNVVISSGPVDFGALPGEMAAGFAEMGFACHLRSEAERTTITVNLTNPRFADVPVAIQVHRQHQPSAETQVTLDTAATSLPCQLLLPLFPQLAALGEETSFRGQLSARESVDGQLMEIAGEFSGVDLQHWLGPVCAAGLTGSAQLQLQRARIINDHCVQAAGRLIAENGLVKRSLLRQAARELGLQWIHDLGAEQGVYERLSCRFDLDESGILLLGEDQGRYAGSVLRHPAGVLLAAEVSPRRLSSQALARSFGSPSTAGLPLSRGALRLLQGPGQQPVLQARPTPLPAATVPR